MPFEAVPVVFFITIGFVLLGWVYFRYRARAEYQHTLRTAIEKGQELSPELLERIGDRAGSDGRLRDLRTGVVTMAIGVGIGVFGIIIGEEDAVRPMIAIGMLPLLVGAALIGLWMFTPRD